MVDTLPKSSAGSRYEALNFCPLLTCSSPSCATDPVGSKRSNPLKTPVLIPVSVRVIFSPRGSLRVLISTLTVSSAAGARLRSASTTRM